MVAHVGLRSALVHASAACNTSAGEIHAEQRELHAIPVTVIIPTLNEAARIRAVVENLRWADEVIVADGGSVDGTADLAREAGAIVLDARGGTIGSQRNAAIAIACNRWVLALDADEHVPVALRDEVAETIRIPLHDAYRIRFRNSYLGHEMRHGRWGDDWHVRLFQSTRRFTPHRVHEHLEPIRDVGSLRACIEHSPYRDLAHHIEKIVRYARWAAEDLSARERRASFDDLTFRPLWRFFREYLWSGGWRDGRAGLMIGALSACSALLKYAHLQELDWQSAESRATVPNPLPSSQPPVKAATESQLISSES